MSEYITSMFQNISWLTVALLSAGVLLCIVEIFLPKFGVSGILGIVLVGTGMSSYYIDGFKLKYLIGLLSIITLVIAIFIIIEAIFENKGVIKNPDRYKFRTYNNVPLSELLGKLGVAYTNIDFGGTIEVDGKLYYAISESFIGQGKQIQVVAIRNNTLLVRGI